MRQAEPSLSSVLADKKELLQLFLLAAVIAFTVGVLSTVVTTLIALPAWTIVSVSVLLLLACFYLLAADLRRSLSFEDKLEAVLFIAAGDSIPVEIENYNFSHDLRQVLSAVKSENRSIYA